MENRTLTKKTVAIYFAVAVALNKAFTLIGNYIVFGLFDTVYEELEGSALSGYYSTLLSSIATLVINILTIGALIILGNKLTKNKIRTILFVGCYYFGAAVAGLFSSFVTNICQYLMIHFIPASTGSTIINICMFIILIPAIYASYMAFTALEGVNEKIPAHPMTISLSQARVRYVISFVVAGLIGGGIVSVPNLLMALINPDSGTFLSYALIFFGYFAKWLTVVIGFAVVYLIGYKSTKSHFGAISFYLPADALAVPVTTLIGNISMVIIAILNYTNQVKILESESEFSILSMLTGDSQAATVVAAVASVITAVAGFAISFKALGLFYTNNIQSEEHIQQ